MSNIVINNSLKFVKKDKLEHLSSIRNYYLQRVIGHLLFGRFYIKNVDELTIENFEKSKCHLYKETIDIEYLKSEDGEILIKKLITATKYCMFDGYYLRRCINNDKDVEFISFYDLKHTIELNFYKRKITDKAIKYLIKSDFEHIEGLDLSKTLITDKAVEYLIKCNFKQLKHLFLSKTQITDKAAEYLIKCDFKQISWLDLSDTHITDQAIEYLIKCDFKQIEIIWLNNTLITDIAIDYLIKCDFKKLNELSLINTKIKDKSKIKSKYTNCSI